MRVLIACEFSGIVRDAFLERGHDAWSCDLIPTESKPEHHYQQDVLPILYQGDWDLIIAHPPCTYLANSGVRWLYNKDGTLNGDRWGRMDEARTFFFRMLNAPSQKVAVENPIPHKHAKLPPYHQRIQPWMFGDNESKSVCLWLHGLPPLVPNTTQKPDNVEQRVWKMPPSADRQKERSRFFKGIAQAMAEQWG